MPTFDELARQGNCPVIHSQRSDEATLIATRVPIDDIRLERWGWVLTLIPKDGRTDQNDIETLRDNAGRQFPKVYLLKDMQTYCERWACTEWEEGYHNGHQTALAGSHTATSADILQEDVLKQLLGELQERQGQTVAILKDEVRAQLETTRSEITLDNARFYQQLQDQAIDAYNRVLEHSRTKSEVLGQELVTQSVKVTEMLETQSLLTREETEKHVETLTEEIRNRVSQTQKSTLDAIEAQFLMSRADTANHLEREHEEIKTDLAGFTRELKELQEQIKQALEALDPDIEEDLDKTQNADPASTATKLVRRATTQIERITQSHQRMSMNYYNSANEQSRKGFRLAWMLWFTSVGLLAFTIVAAVFMAILHLYGFTVLFGAIGGIGTTIVAVMGALSSFHARTAEQFALAQKLLDRSYRPTIANAMCIGYTDEDRKQAAIDKIIDGLLKNEATSVALK